MTHAIILSIAMFYSFVPPAYPVDYAIITAIVFIIISVIVIVIYARKHPSEIWYDRYAGTGSNKQKQVIFYQKVISYPVCL